jgi:ParB family chromosome partitioning protein
MMPKDTIQPDIRHVPLDDLYLHDLNPRQHATEDQVEAKAASMATQTGLLHYLMAYEDPGRDGLGIVAGGLRLRGLQKLAGEGWARNPDQPMLDPVPVRVTSDEVEARAWALGDNVGYEPMTAAQEVRAYAAMHATGAAAGMIARAFGKPERHVARRLALASLPGPALDALEDGQITLEMARTLTIARSDEALAEALDLIDRGEINNDWQLRNLLTPDTIPSSDFRARCVGLPAYFEAGGTSKEDLFADKHLLYDEDILDHLFRAKLDAAAERLKEEEGWAEVVAIHDAPHVGYSQTEKMQRLFRTPAELPEGDLEEMEELEELGEEGLTAEGAARLEELRQRARGDFTDEYRAIGTVFVYADRDGEITASRAWAAPTRKSGSATGTASGPADTRAKPAISDAVRDDLGRLRLAALMGALCDQSELMLDLLAYQFATPRPSWSGPLGIEVKPTPITPGFEEGVLIDARVTETTPDHFDFEAEFSWEGFEAFRAEGKKHRNTILARTLGRLVNGFTSNGFIAEMETALSPGLRKVWTPTAGNFFNRVRSDYLDRLWADLLDLEDEDPRRAEFAKLSKGQKAKELGDLFSNADAQEAHGLSREQIARIDAWTPELSR